MYDADDLPAFVHVPNNLTERAFESQQLYTGLIDQTGKCISRLFFDINVSSRHERQSICPNKVSVFHCQAKPWIDPGIHPRPFQAGFTPLIARDSGIEFVSAQCAAG